MRGWDYGGHPASEICGFKQMGNGDLTTEAFNTFLTWLNADHELAAQQYEAVRRRLIVFFEGRRCATAEELADQTINRVIGRVPTFEGKYEGDPVPYFYRVAHYVYLGYLDTQVRRDGGEINEATLPAVSPALSQTKELQSVCLDECLKQLAPAQRWLVLQYYQENKQTKIERRKWLAEQLGESLNALRLQLHKLRGQLRGCVTSCEEKRNPW